MYSKTYHLALALSLLATGCGLIKFKTKGFGETAKTKNARTSAEAEGTSEDRDGPRGTRPKRKSKNEVKNDAAFAKKVVDHLVGRAHKLTGFEEDEHVLPIGKGTFSFETEDEYDTMEERLLAIGQKAHGGKPRRDIIQLEACVQETLNGKDKTNRKKAIYRCKTRTSRDWLLSDSGKDIFLRGVYLEHALEGVSDKVRKKAVAHFVKSLGYRVVPFRVEVPDNKYGVKAYVLEKVPMAKWPQTTLRYAMRFGQEHGASKSSLAKVKKAQSSAPKHKCITRTLVMARDHEGGGRYSEVYWDEHTRASGKFVEHSDIDCAKVKQKPADAALLRVFKREHDEPKTVLRAHYRSESTWSTFYNNLDIPTMKRRHAQVYFRVET